MYTKVNLHDVERVRERFFMKKYSLSDSETKFAEIIWDNEPLASKQLVSLCADTFDWKSTTTYTVLRRLCDKGVFQNKNCIITSKISREEYLQQKSRGFIEEAFNGSLPCFLAAFLGKKNLTQKQLDEIRDIFNKYEE